MFQIIPVLSKLLKFFYLMFSRTHSKESNWIMQLKESNFIRGFIIGFQESCPSNFERFLRLFFSSSWDCKRITSVFLRSPYFDQFFPTIFSSSARFLVIPEKIKSGGVLQTEFCLAQKKEEGDGKHQRRWVPQIRHLFPTLRNNAYNF